MVRVLIALGSNLGEREGNLRGTITQLSQEARVTRVSSVYETEPMYYEKQGWFLNCVVEVETSLSPRELLELLQSIERRMGRVRGRTDEPRYGPRPIDLDILFYGERVVSEPGLEVPHPRMAERLFVLVPLTEIRPEFVHPVLGRRASELLEQRLIAEGSEAERRGSRTNRVIKRPEMLADLVFSS